MNYSIAERSESVRAPSPLPRAEVFCGLAPTTSKLRHLPPSTPVYAVTATSPGSSVTASPAVSPASSASCADAFPGGLPRVSGPVSVQAGSMSTADDPEDVEDVPLAEQNMNEEDRMQVAEIDTEDEISAEDSDEPQRTACDEFSEDDFTDRFDSFVPVAFDRDAALDDYLVYSRRYGSKPALPPELRDEFPRKRNVGEALWERLYSDISGTFAPRSRTRGSMPLDTTPLRKMTARDRPRSAAPNSVRASSGAAERRRRQRAMAPRAASAHELPNRPSLRDAEGRRQEPAHSLAKDDFIDFQNLPARASASARRRWVKRWRGMLRSFGGRRR